MAAIVDTAAGSRIQIPTLESDESTCSAFVDHIVNKDNSYRRRNALRMALTHWAYKGVQWLLPPGKLLPHDSVGYRFETVRSRISGLPQPVDNHIASFVDKETARMARRQQEPIIKPGRPEPRLTEAAKLATMVCKWDLERCDWPTVRRQFFRGHVTAGIGILHTWLEELAGESRMMPTGAAVACPTCGLALATPLVSLEDIGRGAESVGVQGLEQAQQMDEGLMLSTCPHCEPGLSGPLVPYEPNEGEIEEGLDVYGRPFGISTPKVQPIIEAVPWWEIYPANGGRRVTSKTQRMWGRRSVRSIDWCYERFPETPADLSPDSTHEIMQGDPEIDYALPGGEEGWISGMGRYDAESFINDVVVREVHIQPRKQIAGMEQGLSIYVLGASRKAVILRPLMMDVSPEPSDDDEAPDVVQVPRSMLHVAQFKADAANFWGRSACDDMLQRQWALNILDSQVEDIRDKGTPQVVLKPGEDFYERYDSEGVLGVYEFDSDAGAERMQDRVIFAQPLTGNGYMLERDKIEGSLNRLGAPQLELGQPERGGITATEIAMRAEQIKQNRSEREQDVDETMESAFKHMLDLRWAGQRLMEQIPSDLARKLSGSPHKVKAFEGADLLGQTDVELEVAGGSDRTILEQATAERAKEMGLYDLQSRSAKDRFLDLLGAPKLDEDQSKQVERVQQAWADFVDSGKVVVFDSTVHNAAVWYEFLAQSWLDEQAQEWQGVAAWEEVLRAIGGWEEQFQTLVAEDVAARELYGAIPPDQWLGAYQAALAALPQQQADSVAAGQIPALKRVPPPPQVDETGQPQFLPKLMSDKLLYLWRAMIPAAVVDSPEIAQRDAWRERLLPMYALIQETRLTAQAEAQAMQPVQPPTGPPAEAA